MNNENIHTVFINREYFSARGYELGDSLSLLGMLPKWAENYHLKLGVTLRSYMEDLYGFPMSYTGDGYIDDKDRYHYPEDPPLEPLYSITFNTGQRMIIYLYGLVSFLDFNKNKELTWYHTRMD